MASEDAPATRAFHTAVWTGQEMIIWGGIAIGPPQRGNTGARYDPARDEWTPLPVADMLSPRYEHTAVWTGTEMIIWGGHAVGSASVLSDGAVYWPAADSWDLMEEDGTPSSRYLHTAVWTGAEMIVWGGGFDKDDRGERGRFSDGGRYMPP